MIRKYHNNTLQTNLRHREEELQKSHDIRKTNKVKQPALSLSLPHQDDCKTRKDT